MSHRFFFPNEYVAWTFVSVLVGILCVASVVDFRRYIIPKWITLPLLGLGLVFNVVRGAWLGAEGRNVWLFGESGAVAGAFDGLLFAIAGFAAGFGLFLLLWILGGVQGGDVKLFAAEASWIGPFICLWILAGAVSVLVVFSILSIMVLMVTRGPKAAMTSRKGRVGKDGKLRPSSRLMTLSLPITIATIFVLCWFFRYDLRLATPPSSNQSQSNAVTKR